MKILLFDIETAPSKGYVWSLWTEMRSTEFIESDWYILCWSAKWLDSSKVHSSALTDFPKAYSKNKEDDKKVLQELWSLLDEADVVIAHNGIKFDCKKVNTRFILNGITPPSTFRVIDTLRVAKAHFAFTSNRLNDIGKYLGVGEKLKHSGFKLWKGCMESDTSSWKKMVSYCKQDVKLLERVYLKFRPYISNHPNVGVYNEGIRPCCPKCGSDKIYYRGWYHTNLSKFKRYSCRDCGGWGRLRVNELDKEVKKGLGTN